MDDVRCWQPSPASDYGFTGRQALRVPRGPNLLALFQNFRPPGAVNGAVDPATAEQARVGSVDDGRYGLAGDVALHEANSGGKVGKSSTGRRSKLERS